MTFKTHFKTWFWKIRTVEYCWTHSWKNTSLVYNRIRMTIIVSSPFPVELRLLLVTLFKKKTYFLFKLTIDSFRWPRHFSYFPFDRFRFVIVLYPYRPHFRLFPSRTERIVRRKTGIAPQRLRLTGQRVQRAGQGFFGGAERHIVQDHVQNGGIFMQIVASQRAIKWMKVERIAAQIQVVERVHLGDGQQIAAIQETVVR